ERAAAPLPRVSRLEHAPPSPRRRPRRRNPEALLRGGMGAAHQGLARRELLRRRRESVARPLRTRGELIPMAVRIVRLGTPRGKDEGLRIGTVRRPPRGVPKSEFASQNWYDVWSPNLAPSDATVKLGQKAEKPAQWTAFARKYRAEMTRPDASRVLD